MNVIVKNPSSKDDFEKYYSLRWRILRLPWQQPEGSEKDDLEGSSYHVMACDENNNIIGVGRLHFVSELESQIRYMAVEKNYERKSFGSLILKELESYSLKNKRKRIILNAREKAVGFYKKHGYTVDKKTHVLYGSIQHYEMSKRFL